MCKQRAAVLLRARVTALNHINRRRGTVGAKIFITCNRRAYSRTDVDTGVPYDLTVDEHVQRGNKDLVRVLSGVGRQRRERGRRDAQCTLLNTIDRRRLHEARVVHGSVNGRYQNGKCAAFECIV